MKTFPLGTFLGIFHSSNEVFWCCWGPPVCARAMCSSRSFPAPGWARDAQLPVAQSILATQTEAKNTQKYLPSTLQSCSLQQEGEPLPWRPEIPQKMQKKKKNPQKWGTGIAFSSVCSTLVLAKPQVSHTSSSEVFARIWAVKIFP